MTSQNAQIAKQAASIQISNDGQVQSMQEFFKQFVSGSGDNYIAPRSENIPDMSKYVNKQYSIGKGYMKLNSKKYRAGDADGVSAGGDAAPGLQKEAVGGLGVVCTNTPVETDPNIIRSMDKIDEKYVIDLHSLLHSWEQLLMAK
eukprot:TRINITY_DN1339_c0_g1_i1.p5 TRINITY_DN1339_c0_g1~~TRINITY_DN1339_c0_g1_i1.p5  ORF type:complete len:145 (-),score=16.44 TRINITY_DN1339_c0_g1_i1:1732-2166(-)